MLSEYPDILTTDEACEALRILDAAHASALLSVFGFIIPLNVKNSKSDFGFYP